MTAIKVFEHEPDLLASMAADEAERARERGTASSLSLDRGPWKDPPRRPPDGRHLGLLIVGGLISHRICVASREAVELLGPGDLLRPWIELEDLSVPYEAGWHVEAPTRLAVLDAYFSTGVAAWPEIVSALMDRLTLRTRWLGVDLAVASARGVETRLLLALWYCADRWGRVTAEGVVIPLPLTHALLAEVIGARRPSVSAAASALEEQGRAGRHGRGWVLFGDPPPTVESLERQFRLEESSR